MLTVSLLYSMILDMMAREGEMLQMSLHNFILDYFKESEEPILIFLKTYSRINLLGQVLLAIPGCKIV